jgi:hypothetical protein
MTKEELIRRIRESRGRIEDLCAKATLQELEDRPDPQSDWTIKALIAHLTFWEHATLDVVAGLASADSLKNVHAINSGLLAKSSEQPVAEVLREFAKSGERLTQQIEALSDEELQEPAPWGDGIPLIEHLADDTYVHYQEHNKTLHL